MAGYMVVTGPCWICRQLFTFNAESVPSLVVDGDGDRKPICETCVPEVNAEFERIGRNVRLTILPGSYDPEEV